MAYCEKCKCDLEGYPSLCPVCFNPIQNLDKETIYKTVAVIDEAISQNYPYNNREYDKSFSRLNPAEIVRTMLGEIGIKADIVKVIEVRPMMNAIARVVIYNNDKILVDKDFKKWNILKGQNTFIVEIDSVAKNDPPDMMASCLAHEVTHIYLKCLDLEDIIIKRSALPFSSDLSIEYITDITTLRLGFTDLMLSGYKVHRIEKKGFLTTTKTIKKVGYLTIEDMEVASKYLSNKYRNAVISENVKKSV